MGKVILVPTCSRGETHPLMGDARRRPYARLGGNAETPANNDGMSEDVHSPCLLRGHEGCIAIVQSEKRSMVDWLLVRPDRGGRACLARSVRQAVIWYMAMLTWLLPISLWLPGAQAQSDDRSADRPVPSPGPVNFTTAPSCKDEAVSQLRAMIEKDYQYWTGSRDRLLTIREIGKLQRDPKVTYGQAVLLGVLALTIDHAHGFIDRLDFDSIMALAAGDTIQVKTNPDLAGNAPDLTEPPTFTFRNLVTNYHKLFDNLVSNITPDGYRLWGREKGPVTDGLQQGAVGDCCWIAAIEAVVEKRPEVVMQTIRQLGPDKFELNFRGQDRPVVVTLTHGAMSQLSLDPHQGCWLTLLALGEAAIRDSSQQNLPDFWRHTPLGVVVHGGSQEQVFESLMGRKYVKVRLRRTPRQAVAAMLAEAMRQRMPVGVSTGDHCLSICDYNPDSQMLTILNPWGTSGKYHIEGSDVTVDMNQGMFEIPLRTACRAFSSLSLPARAAGAD